MKKLSYLLFALMLAVGCTSQTSQSEVHQRLDNQTWDKVMSEAGESPQLIDVRTPAEYAEGHFEGARNIDFNGDDFDTLIATLDKEAPVYVYCRSGGRSFKASEKMVAAGFTDVKELQSGYSGYTE